VTQKGDQDVAFDSLLDAADQIGQQLGAIGQEFYTYFEDDYDFPQIIIARSSFANRHHFSNPGRRKGS
jgi:hypothetical protein